MYTKKTYYAPLRESHICDCCSAIADSATFVTTHRILAVFGVELLRLASEPQTYCEGCLYADSGQTSDGTTTPRTHPDVP